MKQFLPYISIMEKYYALGLVKIFNVKKIAAFVSAVVMSAVITADAFKSEAYDYFNDGYGYGYGYGTEPFNDAAISDTHIEDGNSLSRAMNEAIAANEDTAEEGMPVSIHDAVADMTSSTVTVDYSSITGTTIVVALYDDECTQMLTSGKTEIEYNESGTATVAFDYMPQYFYLKAYAVSDITDEPLSNVYENHYYTQEWQEFFSKTVNDFDPAQVINLDNDPTKNFAALYADTANIQSDGIHNNVVSADYDNMIFVIENPDEKITGLTMGQKVVIWGTFGEFIITRVKQVAVETDGSYATVYGESLAAEEVFEHLNFDMGTEGQTHTYEPHENEIVSLDIPDEDMAEIERQIEAYQAQEAQAAQEAEQAQAMFFSSRAADEDEDKKAFTVTVKNKDYKIRLKDGGTENETDENGKIKRKFDVLKVESDKFELELKISGDKSYSDIKDVKVNISGTMTGTLGIDPDFRVLYYISKEWSEAKLITDIKVSLHYVAEGLFDFTAKIFTLPSVSIDGFGLINVNAGDVTYHAYAEGKINIFRSFTLIITLGGYKNGSEDVETISNVQVLKGLNSSNDVNLEIRGGIILYPNISLTKDPEVASVGVQATGDVVLEFKSEKDPDGKPLSENHLCSHCMNLTGHFEGTLQGKWILNKEPHPIGSAIEKVWDNFLECYWSNIDNYAFKEGKCPHKAYNVTFKVVKQTVTTSGLAPYNNYEGATINYTNTDSKETGTTGKTDTKGKVVARLEKGTYTYSVKDKNNKLMKIYNLGEKYFGEVTVGEEDEDVMIYAPNIANTATTSVYSNYSMRSYSVPRAEDGVIPANINDIAVVIPVGGDGEKIKQFESCNRTYGAVTENGDLYMWGNNTYGQLGNGTTEWSSTPVFVMGNVSRLYLFWNAAAAVTKDGKFYSWGAKPVNINLEEKDLDKQIQVEKCLTPEIVPIPGKVVSAFLSSDRNAAVTADGSVYMWGRIPFVDENDEEEVFVVPGAEYRFMRVPVTCYLEPTRIDIGSNFKYVCTNGEKLALVTENGEMYGCSYEHWDDDAWPKSLTRVLDNIGNVETIYLEVNSIDDSFIITKDGRLYYMKETVPENTQLIMSDVASYVHANIGHVALTKDGKILYWDSYDYSAENIMTYSYVDNPIAITGNSYDYFGHTLGILTADGKIYDVLSDDYPPEQIEITKENSTEEAAVPASYSLPAQNMKYYGFYSGAQQETKSFSGLIPNAVYNFYVMKDREADNQYSADNLLYIEQKTSDAGGNLTFVYTPTMTAADTDAFVEIAERIDFTGSDFYAYNIEYDGEEHFVETSVFLNGEELQIGRDYTLCGNYSVTEPGTYELILLGQGRYKGAASVTFDVYTGSYVPEPTPDEPLKSVTINGTSITVSKNMTYEIPYSDWNGGNNFTVNAEAGDGYTATVEPSSFTANSADFVQTVTITVSDGITSEIYILTVTASGCNHNYGSYFSDGNGHWRECIECGNEEHWAHDSLRSEVTVPPTEYSEGLRTYYCSVCGYAV